MSDDGAIDSYFAGLRASISINDVYESRVRRPRSSKFNLDKISFFLDDGMVVRNGSDLTGYIEQVKRKGGWLGLRDLSSNNTVHTVTARHWVNSWNYRGKPVRSSWDYLLDTFTQARVNLPINPRFDTLRENLVNPPIAFPDGRIMDHYAAVNFLVWRYHVVKNGFDDAMFDSYIRRVSKPFKLLPPFALHRRGYDPYKVFIFETNQLFLELGKWGWYFREFPVYPDISGYGDSTLLPLKPIMPPATFLAFKTAWLALAGSANPYYIGPPLPPVEPPVVVIPQGPHVLAAGSSMPHGGTGLVSLNGSFTFRLYTGLGNLSLRTSAQDVLWDSPGKPDGTTAGVARLTLDGNLELITYASDVYWETDTADFRLSNCYLILLDTGVVELHGTLGGVDTIVWAASAVAPPDNEIIF